jgi:hypothetical protein
VSAGIVVSPTSAFPCSCPAPGNHRSPLPQAAFRGEWDSSLTIWDRVSFAAIMGAEYALPSLVSTSAPAYGATSPASPEAAWRWPWAARPAA